MALNLFLTYLIILDFRPCSTKRETQIWTDLEVIVLRFCWHSAISTSPISVRLEIAALAICGLGI